jgi:AcrR family transcriptional regulator
MTRTLTDQGRERRQQLLDASARLFAEQGYTATRIADICEAAGVAKGLFYWYFENKEALFAELMRSVRQQLRRAQAAAMDDAADPLTRIRQGAEASVRFMSEHTSFFSVVADAGRHAGRDAAIATVLAEGAAIYTADVERLIDKAKADGQIPEDADSHLLALGVVGSVAQFAHHQRAGRVELDGDELAGFVGTWVVRALGA